MADMNSSNLSASAEQELAQAADTGQAEPLYILTSLNVNEHSILVNQLLVDKIKWILLEIEKDYGADQVTLYFFVY